MPGKVNPTQAEALAMIAVQVSATTPPSAPPAPAAISR
jgi:fumarate hydratase class II